MAKLLQANLPCPCGKSKRGFAKYSDGSSYCFHGACEHPYKQGQTTMNEQKDSIPISPTRTLTPITEEYRGISPDILTLFGIQYATNIRPNLLNPIIPGPFLCFPLFNNRKDLVHEEYLHIQEHFRTSVGSKKGKDTQLFGSLAFPYDTKNYRYVTLVEGRLDAPSAYQMLNKKGIVYSINSAGEAADDLKANIDYLNSFERIYICFDNDEAGQAATKAAIDILPAHKIFIFPHDIGNKELKDANDYLTKGKATEFLARWWKSKPPKIEGIVSSIDTYRSWLKEEATRRFAYPFPTLEEKLFGPSSNELILISAESGVGKTTLLRELEYQALTKTKDNIGILHFEDTHQELLYGLMNIHANKRFHLPTTPKTPDEIEAAFAATWGTNRLVTLDNFGSYNPETLRNRIEHLIKVYQCRYIFFDHITIAVTGSEKEERHTLDNLATQLRVLCKDNDTTIFVISHVNDDGKPRGSRAIHHICNTHLNLSRDVADDDNKMKIKILKARFAGSTGFGGRLEFNKETGRLNEIRVF